jgi:hypothetical protein
MSTIHHPEVEELTVATPSLRLSLGSQRLFAIIAVFAMVIGVGSVLGGVFGAAYTYDQAAAQDITTPDDAAIADTPVRGPLTMWSQSDIITHHQLDRTGGLYYSQMDREVPAVDEDGNAVIGEDGEPVMVPNEARASWITATTLTTSLGLGILSYAVSAFAIVVGLTLISLGWVVLRLRRATVALA